MAMIVNIPSDLQAADKVSITVKVGIAVGVGLAVAVAVGAAVAEGGVWVAVAAGLQAENMMDPTINKASNWATNLFVLILSSSP